jgi:hypothetical protein
MPSDPFLEEDSRVLTPEAFDFVLSNELKRALRSQNFLTLLVLQPMPKPASPPVDRTRAVRQVARLISREGRLSVVLLDADMQNSMRVIDRLMSRFDHYEFPTPLTIEVGAACCPTHGADADSLRRAAEARPVHRRDDRGNASNAQ